VVDLLGRIAEQKKATPAQIRWRAACAEAVDFPIPGTTKLSRLDENMAPSIKLTSDDCAKSQCGLENHGPG